MHRTSPEGEEWRRYKEVEVPWASYDEYRLSESSRIRACPFHRRDRSGPIRRREFNVSSLAVLLLFKILFNLSYRTIASASKDLGMYNALGMRRPSCYKTIRNIMRHLNVRGLERVNRRLLPESTELASVDASGMKTTRRGAWVIVRFSKRERWRDFKKVHTFVDLVSKEIIHCLVTKGTSSNHPQLRRMLRRCSMHPPQMFQIPLLILDPARTETGGGPLSLCPFPRETPPSLCQGWQSKLLEGASGTGLGFSSISQQAVDWSLQCCSPIHRRRDRFSNMRILRQNVNSGLASRGVTGRKPRLPDEERLGASLRNEPRQVSLCLG
ncbi:MAG: hypothetical protein V3U09_03760 [Thermoplasmata archaeon]